MKYLNIYKDFIKEQAAQAVTTNPPSTTQNGTEGDAMSVSKQYNVQDLQKTMKDYETQKSRIRSVFSNDKLQDNEIPNLLRDFLKDKNVGKFLFDNEFSQLEADVCNLSRQIRKKELSMKNLEEDIKNERGGVSVLEPSSKENSKENVSQIQKDQESVRKEIQNLK